MQYIEFGFNRWEPGVFLAGFLSLLCEKKVVTDTQFLKRFLRYHLLYVYTVFLIYPFDVKRETSVTTESLKRPLDVQIHERMIILVNLVFR